MAAISAAEVQRLRAETNAGVMDCKRALEAADGDFAKAVALIKERGLAKVAKKSDRETTEGLIASYIHGGRIGALVELASETDFVARNPQVQELAAEVAKQVAAMAPADVSALLAQAYIRDAKKTIGDLVTAVAAATGENIHVRRFVRFQLGE